MKLYKVQCVIEIPIGSDTAREAERLLNDLLIEKHPMKTELSLEEAQYNTVLIEKLEDLPELWKGCNLFNSEDLDSLLPEEVLENGIELAKQKALKQSGEDIVNDAIDKLSDLGMSDSNVQKLLSEYVGPKKGPPY